MGVIIARRSVPICQKRDGIQQSCALYTNHHHLKIERLSRFHRFRGCTDVINGATECVTAYETLEHERKSRLRPHISMKFRRAARARKFRNKFREILRKANQSLQSLEISNIIPILAEF